MAGVTHRASGLPRAARGDAPARSQAQLLADLLAVKASLLELADEHAGVLGRQLRTPVRRHRNRRARPAEASVARRAARQLLEVVGEQPVDQLALRECHRCGACQGCAPRPAHRGRCRRPPAGHGLRCRARVLHAYGVGRRQVLSGSWDPGWLVWVGRLRPGLMPSKDGPHTTCGSWALGPARRRRRRIRGDVYLRVTRRQRLRLPVSRRRRRGPRLGPARVRLRDRRRRRRPCPRDWQLGRPTHVH